MTEPGGNLSTSELTFIEDTSFAADSPLAYDSDDGTSIEDLNITAESLVRLSYRGTMTGSTSSETGAGADRIRFIDVLFQGGSQFPSSHAINTRGGADTVSLESSFVGGAMIVNLGISNDTMENLFATLVADSELNGEIGRDFLEEPTGSYATRNFEQIGIAPTVS